LLVFGEEVQPGVALGCRETFADVAATIADHLGVDYNLAGDSFYLCLVRK
jgi:phosphopentomutase